MKSRKFATRIKNGRRVGKTRKPFKTQLALSLDGARQTKPPPQHRLVAAGRRAACGLAAARLAAHGLAAATTVAAVRTATTAVAASRLAARLAAARLTADRLAARGFAADRLTAGRLAARRLATVTAEQAGVGFLAAQQRHGNDGKQRDQNLRFHRETLLRVAVEIVDLGNLGSSYWQLSSGLSGGVN